MKITNKSSSVQCTSQQLALIMREEVKRKSAKIERMYSAKLIGNKEQELIYPTSAGKI